MAEVIPMPHRLTLDDRAQLSLTGVTEVERFDENEIIMNTSAGTLIIRGEELHIEKLSLDGGDVNVCGQISSLSYEAQRSDKGFFARLLGG